MEKRSNPACNFVMLLEAGDRQEHCGPKTGMMEGEYWKCHIQAVTWGYRKWRTHSCAQLRKTEDEPAAFCPPRYQRRVYARARCPKGSPLPA
ncbi:carbohydrate-responsive element-binding protein-like [Pelecanus crispus]|uniref:carbohydrate-responsive element-binding protein-like n=1 Tax=Pelecanus crispus TaxID=36300 RepID=UPI003F5D0946